VIIILLTQKHYFDYDMKTTVCRWEANQIPRVKVAKIYSSAARNEQTPYMPEIPDIPKCLPDLRASKQWEDRFIVDFEETRMVSYLV
jgi:gem associated protein 2